MKDFIRNIAAIAFWIAVWQTASLCVGMELLLPSPFATLMALTELVQTSDFWLDCAYSVLRILSGLLSGAFVAVLIAVITHLSKNAKALFSPVLTVIKATPIASFIILALLWIGRENVPSFITFLIVLPIIWSATHHSIETIDDKLIEISRVFNFTLSQKLRHLYVPSVFPAFLTAFMTSVGIAWKAGVAAEVLCTPTYSLGTSIFESKKYLETSQLFAYTVTVIILSLAIEKMLLRICTLISEKTRKETYNDKDH